MPNAANTELILKLSQQLINLAYFCGGLYFIRFLVQWDYNRQQMRYTASPELHDTPLLKAAATPTTMVLGDTATGKRVPIITISGDGTDERDPELIVSIGQAQKKHVPADDGFRPARTPEYSALLDATRVDYFGADYFGGMPDELPVGDCYGSPAFLSAEEDLLVPESDEEEDDPVVTEETLVDGMSKDSVEENALQGTSSGISADDVAIAGQETKVEDERLCQNPTYTIAGERHLLVENMESVAANDHVAED